jgi:hypothetical protein
LREILINPPKVPLSWKGASLASLRETFAKKYLNTGLSIPLVRLSVPLTPFLCKEKENNEIKGLL